MIFKKNKTKKDGSGRSARLRRTENKNSKAKRFAVAQVLPSAGCLVKINEQAKRGVPHEQRKVKGARNGK